jgi:hypothetical protein
LKSARVSSVVNISRVENGHTVPFVDTLEELARSPEIPMYRFFTDAAQVKVLHLSYPNKPRIVTTKDEREVRSFARLFSRMDEKNRGVLFHMASKMANRG